MYYYYCNLKKERAGISLALLCKIMLLLSFLKFAAMIDIYHDLVIKSSPDKVFAGISTSEGLDSWWTKSSEVSAEVGAVCTLNFGPGYVWNALVTKCETDKIFELQMTDADPDWTGTLVGFKISPANAGTLLSFYHTGWHEINAGYKFSSYCWAMYLRILKRNVEFGEEVAYEKRLSV